jgi:DNA-binding MarR family transcriptional regulator
MTAEIAIMNKSAVALAADSAVTVQHGGAFKIFETNKLFHLCNSSPVGIMVYQNAELMSVPWETIIKNYRKQLGSTTFNTLEEYGSNFIFHLSNNLLLFPEVVQDDLAGSSVRQWLGGLSKTIDEEIKELASKKSVSDAQIRRVTRTNINDWHGRLKAQPVPPDLPQSMEKEILQKYRERIDKVIAESFESLPLTEQLKKRLRDIAVWVLSRDLSGVGSDNYSGLVIAGFGETDLYPSVITYRVESVVLNRLRYVHLTEKSQRITAKLIARVIAFAQDEMVAGFMEGVDPEFLRRIFTEMSKIFSKVYPDEIVKKLPGLTKKRKETLLTELRKLGTDLVGVFGTAISEHRQKKHVDPIVRAVSVLPKEELAAMAEALVSLTSTKRRVTLDAETVGGPIDVAVISKGDGFIWIKRKHYFEADKNPQFLSKYNH